MNAQTALEAIRARIRGEWDNPALVEFGPLGHTHDDLLALVAAGLRDSLPTHAAAQSPDSTPLVSLLNEAVEYNADSFDGGEGESVDGADLVEWFAEWRQDAKEALANPKPDPTLKHARAMSDALLKVRPLGGSELFVKVGDVFYADPVFCGAEIERLKADLHEAKKALYAKSSPLNTAAPDMLAALKLTDEWHDLLRQNYPEMPFPPVVRDAIAKAEGAAQSPRTIEGIIANTRANLEPGMVLCPVCGGLGAEPVLGEDCAPCSGGGSVAEGQVEEAICEGAARSAGWVTIDQAGWDGNLICHRDRLDDRAGPEYGSWRECCEAENIPIAKAEGREG